MVESAAMRPPLVLDKSFVRGAPAALLEQVLRDFHPLVSSALVLEILTTVKASDRVLCAERVLRYGNSFTIVEAPGGLLRSEIAQHRPSTPLLERARNKPASFGRRLSSWKLVLTAREVVTIQEWRDYIDEQLEYFLGEAESIDQYYPDLQGVPAHERSQRAKELQKDLAKAEAVLRTIQGEMGDPRFPPLEMLDENWAFYRRQQVHILAALAEYGRHGPGLAGRLRTIPEKERLRREMADFDYRTLGLLAGGLATRDDESARVFRLLSPTGLLVDRTAAYPLPVAGAQP